NPLPAEKKRSDETGDEKRRLPQGLEGIAAKIEEGGDAKDERQGEQKAIAEAAGRVRTVDGLVQKISVVGFRLEHFRRRVLARENVVSLEASLFGALEIGGRNQGLMQRRARAVVT